MVFLEVAFISTMILLGITIVSVVGTFIFVVGREIILIVWDAIIDISILSPIPEWIEAQYKKIRARFQNKE